MFNHKLFVPTSRHRVCLFIDSEHTQADNFQGAKRKRSSDIIQKYFSSLFYWKLIKIVQILLLQMIKTLNLSRRENLSSLFSLNFNELIYKSKRREKNQFSMIYVKIMY